MAPKDMELVRRDFAANGGWETFLAFEDPAQDILVGLLRLRRVSGRIAERQFELRGRCSIVRELHVYGTAVAVHSRDASKHQHQACTPIVRRRDWGRSKGCGMRIADSTCMVLGVRRAAYGGGGAHCAVRAPQPQAGRHQRRGHAPLLPQAGLLAGGALHGQAHPSRAATTHLRADAVRQEVRMCLLSVCLVRMSVCSCSVLWASA